MPRLLDNRVVGCAYDVVNRTNESLVPGHVLTVLDDSRTLAFGPGTTGPTGAQGEQGPQGAQGLQGVSGVPGLPGTPGVVSSYSYHIHLTNNNGSFTVPPGLTTMVISAIGGGSGAFSVPGEEGQSILIDGCPAIGWRSRLNVTSGTVITWTVGAGGGPGDNGGNTVVNIPGGGTFVSQGSQVATPGLACPLWAPPFEGAMYPAELAASGYGSGGNTPSPIHAGLGGREGAVYLEWIQINDTTGRP